MLTEIVRRKIRNCIRRGTYVYSALPETIQKVWDRIEEVHGPSQHWAPFKLRQIESDSFILRYPLGGPSITLIEKSKFTQETEKKLHALMGMKHDS